MKIHELIIYVYANISLMFLFQWRRETMRIQLRFALLLILVIAVALALISNCGKEKTAVEVGHVDIPLEFVVIDDTSEKPIAGASIRLQDPDYSGLPPESPHTLEALSGLDGRYRVNLMGLMYSARSSVSEDGRFLRRLSRWVRYPNWELSVSVDGYQEFSLSYQEFQKKYTGNCQYHENTVPPPIVIRLRRRKG